jgi:hypothetical protein
MYPDEIKDGFLTVALLNNGFHLRKLEKLFRIGFPLFINSR